LSVAQKLKALIDQRGIKYSFLANKTGIPVNQLTKSLHGNRRLLADELVLLCLALDLDLADLKKQ